MEFTQSLKLNRDFRRIYARAVSEANKTLVLYARRNGANVNRIGITVSTKVGKAVVRNKVRRRIREAYRLSEASYRRGFDIVVVARARCAECAYAEIMSALSALSDRLRLLVTSAPYSKSGADPGRRQPRGGSRKPGGSRKAGESR